MDNEFSAELINRAGKGSLKERIVNFKVRSLASREN